MIVVPAASKLAEGLEMDRNVSLQRPERLTKRIPELGLCFTIRLDGELDIQWGSVRFVVGPDAEEKQKPTHVSTREKKCPKSG